MQYHSDVTTETVRISGSRLSYQIAFANDDEQATEHFEDHLGELCLKWVAEYPDEVATIVLAFDVTCDFPGFAQMSFWMSVIGRKDLAHHLVESARTFSNGARTRPEVAIVGGSSERIHLRDGKVWKPYDGAFWAAITSDDLDLPEHLKEIKSELEDDDFEKDDPMPQRSARPVRSRAVRSDARIGSVIEKIEEMYGLPAGSVKIVKPDGSPLRADAFIRTLRVHWE